MEKAMSVEEKVRRAEEIYARRHSNDIKPSATVKVNDYSNKKDIKLLKKMLIQLMICIFIYLIVYVVQNSQFIFSEQFLNKVNEILSYDMNFNEIYNNSKNYIMQLLNKSNDENNKTNSDTNNVEGDNTTNAVTENTNSNQTTISESAIGGAVEENTQDANIADNIESQEQNSDEQNLTQEEIDVQSVKQTTSFIKPLEGTITSTFGIRNPTTKTVPTNHTGTDIAANTGTKIKSATDGEVVLNSEEGDYGKHLKIQIGDVSIIYAHCNQLYVNQGEKVVQGQEIAEVGSTGNSTGPHLHFEIRYQERTVDPQKILDL